MILKYNYGGYMNWNEYFFEMCKFIAKKSKDPNTQIGCVIVGPDNSVRSTGFNGFPRGVGDSLLDFPERYERPEKYTWTEHAERNAIFMCQTRPIDCKIYCTWMPCADCARAIIQSGITSVYVSNWSPEDEEKYPLFRFDASIIMFRESGVKSFIQH
jgi:dCMP deaminase